MTGGPAAELTTTAKVARGIAFVVPVLLFFAVVSRDWVRVVGDDGVVRQAGPLGGEACRVVAGAAGPIEVCAPAELAAWAARWGWAVVAGAILVTASLIAIAALASRRRPYSRRLAVGANVAGAGAAVTFVHEVGGLASLQAMGIFGLGVFAVAVAAAAMTGRTDR